MIQKNSSRALLFLVLAMTMVSIHFWRIEAQAQSSYFTSRGCINCHPAPTTATCAGCHQHSGTLTATKNKTTSYAPGETVSITLTATGARTGWIGARLYNQAGAEVARSTGNQSGMGGSTLYPAVLSAPAPAAAGTYTWRVAYFGNNNGTGSGDVHGEKSVDVSVVVAAAPVADTTAPVVGTFTLPATATSLTVPVTALSATDNVAVTGYMVNKVATAPTAAATGWSATAPTSVAAVAGANTFYAWAKDAAGNVSLAKTAAVTVTLPDTTAPVVGTFTIPATATSLTVPVTALSATDNVAVTGYMVNKVATAPTAAATGWSATAPTSVVAVAGANTFYAWAKDAAGNVSLAKTAAVTVTLPDTTAPVVGTFTLPATATSLTVPVTALSATDNVAVTGYMVNKVATAPTAAATGWSATAPTSVTAVAGANTFYAWAKDAAGNVSLAKTAAVTVTLPDTTAPVVGTFTLPATATSLTVPVTALSATDNVAVTGYMVNKVATAPTAAATGWTATAPTSVAAIPGTNTFYAWAKDAAGNVSLAKTAAVTVTLPDTTAPVIGTFTLPATATSLTVPVTALSATDNVAVTGYMVNKVATAPTAAATGWSATAPTSVAAVAGANIFYAWAKDAAGNVSLAKTASVTVTVPVADTTKPTLTISTLATGSYTNKVTLNVSGSASDQSGLQSVTINGQPVAVNADGSFSVALTLNVGANTVTVVATDKAGNQQSNVRTINFDPAAPVLGVTAPADNSTSAQSFLTVTGTVSETSTVTITDNNGAKHSAAMTGNQYSATINLISGVNTITITATDLAGNSVSAKRTVTYTATKTLALAVVRPSQDITTTDDDLDLISTVSGAIGRVTVKVTVNGITYLAEREDGRWEREIEFKAPGTYRITVTATDEAGNSSSVTRNVIYLGDSDHTDDDD